MKDIREKRRQRQPAPPGVTDMLLDINPGAGSEILSHFKFQWDAIHEDIISSSDVLDTMHMELQKIFQSVNNSHKIITIAHEELTGLPSVIKSLQDTNIKVCWPHSHAPFPVPVIPLFPCFSPFSLLLPFPWYSTFFLYYCLVTWNPFNDNATPPSP